MSGVSEVKKLISILTTSTLMTSTRKEALEYISSIYYPIQFKKEINKTYVQALIKLGSEVNTIHPIFAKQLGLLIRPTDVKVQKFDSSILDTYGIVVAACSVMHKVNQVKFFEKTFLVANINPKVVFEIFFLILSNANIDFLDLEFC